MNNFEQVMRMAIETYAELSGESFEEIAKQCQDYDSQTAKNVRLLMFAAM